MQEDITAVLAALKASFDAMTKAHEVNSATVNKMLDRHEACHRDHYETTKAHGEQIADHKAVIRTIKWVCGFIGLGGISALLKWGGGQ